MVVVADTSPLTALLHLRHIHLLSALYGRVYIPTAVAAELETLPAFGYEISFMNDTKTFIVQSATDTAFVQQLSRELDAGEAEAIALAAELHADLLLIDERLGKEVAQAAGIACKGVVGLLIDAKEKGLIPLVKPLLDDLIQNLKFRLSDYIYRLALQRAGETL